MAALLGVEGKALAAMRATVKRTLRGRVVTSRDQAEAIALDLYRALFRVVLDAQSAARIAGRETLGEELREVARIAGRAITLPSANPANVDNRRRAKDAALAYASAWLSAATDRLTAEQEAA
jgi:hypothetical protein